MHALEIRNLRKTFGSVEVIPGADLAVEPGEFCVFVGPSGCGKSTLLRMIAGLEEPTSGDILIGGQRVNDLPPAKREIAMVFQSYALYPHLTVAGNLGLALKQAGTPRAEVEAAVKRAASMLALEPLLQRRPAELSGGQRQRVAIGRAIVRRPKLFLFDEPLSNLDAALRGQTRIELARLHRELGATMIYVTHDQVEAMTLADRIVVLNAGRIAQIGSPMELYNRPANRFVAGFIGSPSMNFLAAERSGLTPPAGAVELGIRPEHIALADHGIPARVTHVERLGHETLVHTDGEAGHITLRLVGEHDLPVDQPVHLRPDPARAHWFGPDGNRCD
ncbi:ABC transporter ATP-binding protein [Paracoccus sulfuroxidans]|uniref:Carbohydrate ABC transporter ATP-binding protein, CUT1 family (TC 3.A.1.1.-) n=1 Tax=Paracoccus sulfuroxidans TaxID=384678 RepID=A0A562NCN6_9RHOB|nr:ABC transporter ATP-binding protein [Paracoccus sulfuroxidans]TWI29873.1 carbohydrate ABC transporter ATP-binding protein, CUT1 family (TC 3.A.1.1.-) [Paracoccus sulfuroxidans]